MRRASSVTEAGVSGWAGSRARDRPGTAAREAVPDTGVMPAVGPHPGPGVPVAEVRAASPAYAYAGSDP